MSGRLITFPSLKLKKKKKPIRTQSQQAPLATYDDFQLGDASDTEEIVTSASAPDSAPLPRMKHFHSADETNTDKDFLHKMDIGESIDECPDKKEELNNSTDAKENNGQSHIPERLPEICEQKVDEEVPEQMEAGYNAEVPQIDAAKFEKDEDTVKEIEQDEYANETVRCMDVVEEVPEPNDAEEDSLKYNAEENEQEDSMENGAEIDDDNEIDEDEDEDNDAKESDDGTNDKEFDDDAQTQNDVLNASVDDTVLEHASSRDERAVSDYSDVATEPETANGFDHVTDEGSQQADALENDDFDEQVPDGSYQTEMYYEYEEEAAVDAGDDPFSLEYQESRDPDTKISLQSQQPPQIVITEPSDLDLPSLDESKLVKPGRPPEPKKPAPLPKRPPPPGAIKKENDEKALRSIPPPPKTSKRRDRKEDEGADQQQNKTKFPFKSHFEKKPLVPNPKKAILNAIKGESKKERRRRKAEEEFERILTAVDPEEQPVCKSTDEWKAYAEFQQRIGSSVQKTQEKIKTLVEEGKELVEEISNVNKESWADFEESSLDNKENVFEDTGSMSAINDSKPEDVDIWGFDQGGQVEKENSDFDENFNFNDTSFVETFNQRIEENDEDVTFAGITSTADDVAMKIEESFGAEAFSESKEVAVSKSSEHASRERPKPKRQETLSGNNPFRKGSIASDKDNENGNVEDESPFMAVLKSVGVVDLDDSNEPPSGFDPLTTIYPDSGDEKEFDDNQELPFEQQSSDSSDTESDNFGKFKIKNPVNIIDPVAPSDEIIHIIPMPTATTALNKGPRERKLPPEKKPIRNENKDDSEFDEMFSEIRNDNGTSEETNMLNEPSVIVFDTPLSGEFAGQQVEWEAFTSDKNKTNATEDDIWGKQVSFSADFEPLPGEIVTFEPYHPKNENLEWKLLVRQPEKKSKAKQISRYTSNRWWKEVYIRLASEKDRPCLKLFDNLEDAEPYRVVRLEPYMQLSRDKLQQYDKYGKLHIFKVNHILYKEMVGMRTEKFSFKTLQNLVSHKPKMNMVLDHMPIRTEVIKIGSLDQKPLRSLMIAIEDSMMSIKSHRDASLEYTKEEVCCYVNDEYECELSEMGSILKQKARTKIFFAAFVTGNPHIVLGINDKWRYGNEIVRRQDIIPIMHDDWITIYEPEFHSCIDMDEYEKDHMIKFYPLDGCKFELIRFRVPLRENKELPLMVNVKIKIYGVRVDLRVDLSVPGFFSASKRHGAVHCDDIEIRIPIPEEWAYHFRIEKHHKYGSVHSALRKPGKIKGFERITQLAQSLLPPSLLEASAGVAKYEHLYKSIVWRIPRLPEKNEASYKPHLMTCKLILAPHDTVPPPEEVIKTFDVEFNMPASTVSGATVRSISVEHTVTPERFVKYLATFKYNRVIEYEWGDVKPPPVKSILEQFTNPVEETHSSDESPMEKSSQSETANSSPIHKKDSIDLLGGVALSQEAKPRPHSAIDDLLNLDFNEPASKSQFQTDTGNILSGNLFGDIAMVDDDHDEIA